MLAQGRLKDVGPLLVIWAAAMLVLVATNDLGSALLYFGIFIAMLYIATARLSFVLVGLGLFVAGVLRRRPRDPARRTSGSRSGSIPGRPQKVLLPADRARWRSARTARATSS